MKIKVFKEAYYNMEEVVNKFIDESDITVFDIHINMIDNINCIILLIYADLKSQLKVTVDK